MIDPATLTSPVQKGDMPLTPPQFLRLMSASLDRIMPKTVREQLLSTSPTEAAQLGVALSAIQAEAEVNNVFNHQLAAYDNAVDRLAKYRLADGRAEVTQAQPTGAVDDNGDPVMDPVVVSPAIDPLPAQVEAPDVDEDTGEVVGTKMVPNPAIVKDDAERAEAQAVIDATPQEVKGFAG